MYMWLLYFTIFCCFNMHVYVVTDDFEDITNAGGKLSSKLLELKKTVVGVNYMQVNHYILQNSKQCMY